MSRYHPDLVQCLKRTGVEIGLLCDVCDGQCPICGSRVNLIAPAYICRDCSFGNLKDKCILCGGKGKHQAKYCEECVKLGRDRDGCPRVINLGMSRADKLFENKRDVVCLLTNGNTMCLVSSLLKIKVSNGWNQGD